MTSSADNDKNKFLLGIITTRNIFTMIVLLAPIIAGWFMFYIQKTSYMPFELNLYLSLTIGFICLLLSLIPIFILRKYFNRYREIIKDMPEADFHSLKTADKDTFLIFKFRPPVIISGDIVYRFKIFNTQKVEIKSIISADLISVNGAFIFDLVTRDGKIRLGFLNRPAYYYYFIYEIPKKNPTVKFTVR